MADGASPLFIACREGQAAAARLLLGAQGGADVAQPLLNGATPLFIACQPMFVSTERRKTTNYLYYM